MKRDGELRGAVHKLATLGFLVLATTLESSGDAIVRLALAHHTGYARLGLFAVGALMLFGYGVFLNLAPVEFEKVVGLYIATLFIVWQIVNFLFFRHVPTAPIAVGGLLIVIGGCLVTFWRG
jgi:small multidrug resistance family-3 protein